MADDGVKRLHDPIALQTQAGRDPTAFRTPRLSAVPVPMHSLTKCSLSRELWQASRGNWDQTEPLVETRASIPCPKEHVVLLGDRIADLRTY